MESKLYSSLTIITPNTIPNFKIGDTVIYKRSTDKQKYDSDTFTISKMVFFISTEGEKDANGHEFSVTSVLRGVKENGEIMPTDDSFYDSK